MYLYLDTSHELVVGILDLNFDVITIERNQERRSASVIHNRVDILLRNQGIEVSELKGVIVNNGPGSYTGIRVGEGVAKIFELDGVKVASFLEHEAIALTSEKGTWIANAFKNEIFSYSWKQGSSPERKMIDLDGLENIDLEPIFSNDTFQTTRRITNSKTTLLQNINKIAKFYFERNERQEPFYYRSLEEEFQVGKS